MILTVDSSSWELTDRRTVGSSSCPLALAYSVDANEITIRTMKQSLSVYIGSSAKNASIHSPFVCVPLDFRQAFESWIDILAVPPYS